MNREDKRVKRLVEKNRKRKKARAMMAVCFISMISFTMFFAGFKISAITTGAKGLETSSYDKMYKSVMIEQNDNLWDIAERYMGAGYTDTKEYVAEIIELNNLSGAEIHYGEYICIPYYG